jgi:phage tail-like protein
MSDEHESFAGLRTTTTAFRTNGARAAERPPAPAVASARAYLRAALPAIYQEEDGDFTRRFVGALETLLDPIVALLDALPAHIDPDLAPGDMLEVLTAWLGIELRESQPTEERREVVRRAVELGRGRGTRRGIELALSLGFPGVPFRVDDPGRVSYSTDAEALPEAPDPAFVVYCDEPQPLESQADMARLIEEVKPAHVSYRLRVKTRAEA